MGLVWTKDDNDLRLYLAEVDGEMRAFDRDLTASIAKLDPIRAASLTVWKAFKWERLFKGPRAEGEKEPIGWVPFHDANDGFDATLAMFGDIDQVWNQTEAFEHALVGAQLEARAMGAETVESGDVKDGPDFDTKSDAKKALAGIPDLAWAIGAAGVGIWLVTRGRR